MSLQMLLPNKSEKSYYRALEAVLRKYLMLRPKTPMADSIFYFEQAPARAIKKLFTSVVLTFCLFYIGQNHFKNFVKWKLCPLHADAEIKALVRSLTALACLPVSEVERGFVGLVAAINEKISCVNIAGEFLSNIKECLSFIESTYVRRFNRELKPIDTVYPIEVWNCYGILIKKNLRIDNAHERWHFRFNMRFPKAYMSLSRFLLRLQDEEEETWPLEIRHLIAIAFTLRAIFRHEANPTDPLRNQRKKVFERNEDQLQALVEAYSKVDPPLRDQVSFLRHIQLHLAKFELL